MRHPREVSKVDFTWIFRKSKFFSDCFIIVYIVWRTVLIQSALWSPDLGECFSLSDIHSMSATCVEIFPVVLKSGVKLKFSFFQHLLQKKLVDED